MTFLKNTVSLLTVFTIIPAAFAATPRAGIVSGATVMAASGRRMPTVTMKFCNMKKKTIFILIIFSLPPAQAPLRRGLCAVSL